MEDEQGKEVLESADGTQVMMEWERPYMVRCVDALKISAECDVMEVGFGCAYSAERIQHWKPRSHTIIECSPPVLVRLREWAKDKPSVKIVEGTWQSTLSTLGVFDAVFFDDFPLGLTENEEEFGSCSNPAYLDVYRKAKSHLHAFVDLCVTYHMGVDSRLSGYMTHTMGAWRPDISLTTSRMPVRVPKNCTYFDDNVAVVPLITKTITDATLISAADDAVPGHKPVVKVALATAEAADISKGKRKRVELELGDLT